MCGAALAATAPAADVAVSVTIDQPGLYGRININQPPPPAALLYRQPIVIVRPPQRVVERPIYLHVPPGHAKKWAKHCHTYDACGRPVYFVRDDYYVQHYVEREGHDDSERHGERDHDRKQDGDRGKSHGHGKGHSKSRGKHH
ncbi:MAG: hypothetical protein ABIW85_04945 [Variovorax sp.]